MRRVTFIRIIVVALSGVCAGCLAQAKPDRKASQASGVHYEVRGVVVNALNGSPVPHCHLSPSPAGGTRSARRRFPAAAERNVFDADDHGRFSIPLPSPGRWSLTASARGFVTQAYDQHFAFSSAIVVSDGSPVVEVQFKLKPEASITGTVVDEAGEAVRGARISLERLPPTVPGGIQPTIATQNTTEADDRGRYEFDNLASADYRVRVQARPWYAAMSSRSGNTADTDPSLDVAYPVVWFPGADNPEMAETIALEPGDVREADFHLTPIPSIHLKMIPPAQASTAEHGPPIPASPLVEPVLSGGPAGSLGTEVRNDAQGQFDVGGLTPGLYQIRWMGPNQGGRATLVDVKANSARTIDVNAQASDTARITLRFDGADDTEAEPGPGRGAPLAVTLIDEDARSRSFSSNGGFRGRNGPGSASGENGSPMLEVPPGRYEVVLQGRPDLFLTGLTATGAQVSGREITIAAGEAALTVHVAGGRATLSGFALLKDKSVAGAMVMLVPVTIEEKGSITVLRRDQTNTDGSFELDDVIPGKYILLAIDHGWDVNWGDRTTLRRYLMQGVPVELKPSATVRQTIEAQAP